MTTVKEIIPIANQILKDYDLCDSCLGRLFSKQMNLSSNKLLGKKLKIATLLRILMSILSSIPIAPLQRWHSKKLMIWNMLMKKQKD